MMHIPSGARLYTLVVITLVMSIVSGACHAIPMKYHILKYNELVQRAISAQDEPDAFYVKVRRYYSQLDEFQPDGSAIITQMNALAPLVKPHSQDPKDIIVFEDFKRLLLTHLGNITVTENAMYLAQKYPNILNHSRIKHVFYGLYKSLPSSGNGKTQRTAYDIYTLGEESMLLEQLGLKSEFRAQKTTDTRAYAIHNAVNIKTGGPHTVYMNISAFSAKLQEQYDAEEQQKQRIQLDKIGR